MREISVLVCTTVVAVFFLTDFFCREPAAVAPKGQPEHVTKLADLQVKHKEKTDWREVIVDDGHLRGEYVFSRSGTKTPRDLDPDTRSWWVITEGEVRF